MKNFIVSLACLLLGAISLSAQSNIAFINTDTVLESIPEYLSAQKSLNSQSDKYKALIETEVGKIEALYQDYQKRKEMMTASQRASAEQEIISKERAVKEKQQLYFGEDGVMSKKSEELLNPIKARVDVAIEAVVTQMGGIDIVFDLAVNQDIVYYKSENEITQKVIEIYHKLNN